MTQITPTGTISGDAAQPERQHVFRASNNALVAVFDSTINEASYAVSTDDGATWTAAALIPGTLTESGLISDSWGGFMINDVLYLWRLTSDNAGIGVAMNVRVYLLTFDIATNTFTAESHQDFVNMTAGGSIQNGWAVCWDGTVFHVAFAYTTTTASPRIAIFSTPANGTPETQQAIPWSYTSIPSMDLTASPTGQMILVFVDPSRNSVQVIPYTYSGGSYSVGTTINSEIAYSPLRTSQVYVASALDSTNVPDIVIQDGTGIYATRRTSTAVYQALQPVYTGAKASAAFTLASYQPSSALYIVFESDLNSASGEIYVVPRTNGTWQNVQRVVIAPATNPSVVRSVVSSYIDTVYQTGAAVDFTRVPAASPPNAPTNIQPNGNVSSLTPYLSWDYTNPSPANPQSAFQIQAWVHGSPGTLLWDSGQVFDSAPITSYAGTPPAYNQQIDFQVRVWDSVTNGGAGTPSAYSSLGSFTPRHAPVVTITEVDSGGTVLTVSGGTIPARDLTVSGHVTQADGDTTSEAQILIANASGSIFVDQSPVYALSPQIPSGGDFTVGPFTSPLLQDGATYQIVLLVRDGVTGIQAESASFQVTASYPPPPDVTGLTGTADNTAGTLVLAWTNPGGIAGIQVQRAAAGSSVWTTLYDGAVVSSLALRPPPNVVYDYRVFTKSALGILSAGVPLATQSFDTPYSVLFTDTSDPSLTVGLRAYDSWDQTTLTLTQDRQSYVPFGRAEPIAFFGMAAYYAATTVTFWVPGRDDFPDGSYVLGKDIVANMDKLVRKMAPVLYRDQRGMVFYCTLTNLAQTVDEDIHFKLAVDIEQVDYSGTVV